MNGDQASARHRHRHFVATTRHGGGSHEGSYSPPYSDFIIDVNSGAVLHSTSADELRHPASLTKMMTLYLLFERLDAGKIRLDSPIEMSPHAASMAPSKLGLRPGQTISVEDAIKAVVTKSANDVAVAIGETLGGDEPTFAEMMTRKAHALGMTRTLYRNACGLPNDEQVTTAHDQATLARALQDRFPRYFHYFSTPSFTFHGEWMRNHNHLLGSVDGVDGIKTGYIRASGFNLVTSVHRGDRRIVGVIFGGSSAGSRDARMRELISEYIKVGSTRRTAPLVGETDLVSSAHARTRTADALPGSLQSEAPYARVVAPAPAAPPAPPPASRASLHADPAPTNAIPAKAPAGDTDPIKPILVRTLTFKSAGTRTAAVAALPPAQPSAAAAPAAPPAPAAAAPQAEAPATVPAPGPGVLGTLVVHGDGAPAAENQRLAMAEPAPAAPANHARGGWLIQVGAFDAEGEARERLTSAQSRAKSMLASADPYTERVVKGDKTMYRARFAGLDREQAEAACRFLKRNDIACMPLKN